MYSALSARDFFSNFTIMKIYTKTGDKGTTSLFGGTRVPKHHLKVETYGTVDELNAQLGLLKDVIENEKHQSFLLDIQHQLFVIGSLLATESDKKDKLKIQSIQIQDIERIEKEIDELNESLPVMTHFILPGGHPTVSYCHISRCVCRRAERMVTHLNEEETVDELIIQFLNRLSDYLFVLSRKLAQELKVEEIKWMPKKEV